MDHGLGKWPVLLVSDQQVTEEQAQEIIVATTIWTLALDFRDHRAWSGSMAASLGVYPDKGMPNFVDQDALDAFHGTIGVPQMEYLYNQVVLRDSEESGDHWISWDGRIGTSGTYLGSKWPPPGGVTEEWVHLARKFPFLDVSAQLVSLDWSGPEPTLGAVLMGWRIGNGRVSPLETVEPIRELRQRTTEESIAHMLAAKDDKGTDPETVRAAVRRLEGKA